MLFYVRNIMFPMNQLSNEKCVKSNEERYSYKDRKTLADKENPLTFDKNEKKAIRSFQKLSTLISYDSVTVTVISIRLNFSRSVAVHIQKQVK